MTEVVRPVAARIFEVTGALGADASNASMAWRERRGLLLELCDREGRIGQGEASPLPGFSSDTLAEARADLLGVDWAGLPNVAPGDGLLDDVGAALSAAGLNAPAARFAAETALLDLAGQAAGLPVHVLLAGTGPGAGADGARPSAVPLAALLARDPLARDPLAGDLLASAAERVSEGYGCLKVKVGRAPAEELALLGALRAELGDGVLLRADANGSLDVEVAPGWLQGAADLGLEFVEEPLPLARLRELLPSPVSIAIDESLDAGDDSGLAPALEAGGYRYVVLKPGYHGGALRCLRLAAEARSLGALPVVSHLLGGPVALAAAAELALALPPGPAAGLAPHAGLSIWPALELPAYGRAEILSHDRPGLGLPPLASMGGPREWREVG
jgi:o-succinylbenzoate synthase